MKKPLPSSPPAATVSKRKSRQAGGGSSASIAFPAVGDVLNYVFLWSHEFRAGRLEGVKQRPVLVVGTDALRNRVMVCPITTSPSLEGKDCWRIPAALAKRDLRLPRPDESWVVLDEMNSFEWVGFDLRPFDGGDHRFGRAPPRFVLEIVEGVIARNTRPIRRD